MKLISYILILVLSCLLQAQAVAQDRAKKLLESGVTPYKTEENVFSDEFKEELKRALSGVRIIALGEATHEDGATFEHKTDLVKFLHEELDFNVLAFEYGFYGNWNTDQKLMNGEEVEEATRYSGWARSRYAYPVYEYIGKTKMTDRPLVYAGFDGEKVPDGIPNIRNLLHDIANWSDFRINKADSSLLDSLIIATYGGINNSMRSEIAFGTRKRAIALLDSMRAHIKGKEDILGKEIGEAKFKMSYFTLQSIALDEKAGFAGSFRNVVRDKHMAERVRWIADSLYKGQKIILWGATAHFARSMITIDRKQEPGDYGFYPYYQMGDWLQEYFGDQYYVVAFTSGSGETGLVLPDDHRYKAYEEIRPVGNISENSFEGTAMKTGKENLFIDLRSVQPASWLQGEFISYSLGYRQDSAPWYRIVDAFYYIKEMKPDVMIQKRRN